MVKGYGYQIGDLLMSLRIKQLIVIACLLGFVLFVSHREFYKDVNIDSIRTSVNKVEAVADMKEFGASQIKKDYGFNINDYGEAFYYGYESIMDCDKVIVIKLNSGADGSQIISSIRDKNDELKKLFQSYAPDQYTILNNCVLEKKGQYIVYIVSEKASEIKSTIIDCIKG